MGNILKLMLVAGSLRTTIILFSSLIPIILVMFSAGIIDVNDVADLLNLSDENRQQLEAFSNRMGSFKEKAMTLLEKLAVWTDES